MLRRASAAACLAQRDLKSGGSKWLASGRFWRRIRRGRVHLHSSSRRRSPRLLVFMDEGIFSLHSSFGHGFALSFRVQSFRVVIRMNASVIECVLIVAGQVSLIGDFRGGGFSLGRSK